MDQPHDPVGAVLRDFIAELLDNAVVDISYVPIDSRLDRDADGVLETARRRMGANPAVDSVVATAAAEILPGWTTVLSVGFGAKRVARIESVPDALLALPAAALRAAASFTLPAGAVPTPALQRALRDTVIVELLAHHHVGADGDPTTPCVSSRLLAETLEYLIELSGTRVEAHNLTHGVVITDAIAHEPRLEVRYPSGLRDAKRSPLLFDGQRSVLVVDNSGRARTELQAHRLDRLHPSSRPLESMEREFVDSGSLVALATRQLGGIGFFLREDRSIWVFLDGQPLVVRRSEHWTAFPLWLARAIGTAIGGGAAVDLIVGAALLVSVRTGGAIFAIVDDASDIDGIVADKDRFDRRDELGVDTLHPETKLHHLIDAENLDTQTLARLGELDGATLLDRNGGLVAYGAIVSSSDSEHEGARTAAAKSLSEHALVVLKVSEDGDITVFRRGEPVATLLPSGSSR